MTDATNTDLKETIVAAAAQLFMEKGFAATSIRDIANGAGCTTAALYYYFENKQSLFREVMIFCSQDVEVLFRQIQNAENLHDFLRQLGQAAMREMPRMLRNLNWLLLEFPTMSEEDRVYFRQRQMEFHYQLRDMISHFTSDEEADKLAWALFCTAFGYGQLFITMDMKRFNLFSFPDFVDSLVALVGKGLPKTEEPTPK